MFCAWPALHDMLSYLNCILDAHGKKYFNYFIMCSGIGAYLSMIKPGSVLTVLVVRMLYTSTS